MHSRKIILFSVFFLILQFGIGMCMLGLLDSEGLDIVKANELKQLCDDQYDELLDGKTDGMPASDYRYAVLDSSRALLYATDHTVSDNLYEAISNRDTVLLIGTEEQAQGTLIISNEAIGRTRQMGIRLFVYSMIASCLAVVFIAVYIRYLNTRIVKPFRKLQAFASRVAAGNLDLPLCMDQSNVFGAFTESFDLMREELKRAKANEREADRSKKELVAKLSHDIKTPVASIKAVAELMSVHASTEKERQQLSIIETKADQINALISNLFHATLEELQELTVDPQEQDSRMLLELLHTSDYERRAEIGDIPECLVWFDQMRLLQVFDNIFANSYKYANTAMIVTLHIQEGRLVIRIQDFGMGITKEELPLVCEKFFRGKNAAQKSGAGLGLYISRYLMNQMEGVIECVEAEAGFCVLVKLKIC